MYYYHGFGLDFKSTIELPELCEIQNDLIKKFIQIKIGTVPDRLNGKNIFNGLNTWSSSNKYLIFIKNVGKYYVQNGNCITIEPADNADWNSIRLFFLDVAIPALLNQVGFIPLRAAAVKHPKGIILFVGKEGTGKSTTAAFLEQRDYPIFSDDICTILPKNVSDNTFLIHAAYPSIKLWSTTIDWLNDKHYSTKIPIRAGIDKYWNITKSQFSTIPLPLYKIIILHRDKFGVGYEKRTLSPVKKMYLLRSFLYAGTFRNKELDSSYFKMTTQIFSQIIQNIPIIQISRPYFDENINQFIDFIENEF